MHLKSVFDFCKIRYRRYRRNVIRQLEFREKDCSESSASLKCVIALFYTFSPHLKKVNTAVVHKNVFSDFELRDVRRINLKFTGPCVANIFAGYNQQDATFLNLFISVRRSTCCRRFFRPSSGAQNCSYSVGYLSDQYCYLLLARSG